MLYKILRPEFSCRNRIGRFVGRYSNLSTSSSSINSIVNKAPKRDISIKEQKNTKNSNHFENFKERPKSWQQKIIKNSRIIESQEINTNSLVKNIQEQFKFNDDLKNSNKQGSRLISKTMRSFLIEYKNSDQLNLNKLRDSKILQDDTRVNKCKKNTKNEENKNCLNQFFVKKKVKNLKKRCNQISRFKKEILRHSCRYQ